MPGRRTARSAVEAAVDRFLIHRPDRPLALVGPSGSGKTTLLREALRQQQVDSLWLTARDLVEELVAAIRSDRGAEYERSFAADPRPLVVEHLEDLRDKPRTQVEVQRLIEKRSERRHRVVLTITHQPGGQGVIGWLCRFADVRRLNASADRARTR